MNMYMFCCLGNLPVLQGFGGPIHPFPLKKASSLNSFYFIFIAHVCLIVGAV